MRGRLKVCGDVFDIEGASQKFVSGTLSTTCVATGVHCRFRTSTLHMKYIYSAWATAYNSAS